MFVSKAAFSRITNKFNTGTVKSDNFFIEYFVELTEPNQKHITVMKNRNIKHTREVKQ